MQRNPGVDWAAVDEVLYGCANQAGEDNRNVARMASLLAGLPQEVPGATINRLCGSGLDAVGTVARGIKAGEIELAIAGARVIDSTPPVSTISASPVSIIREPFMAASREEPHSRFIVVPGTVTG